MAQGVPFTPAQVKKFKQLILDYIIETPMGTMWQARKKYHLSNAVVCKWRTEDPEFERQLTEAREKSHHEGGDIAERRLYDCIQSLDFAAIKFYLQSRHAARGYQPLLSRYSKQEDGTYVPTQQELDSMNADADIVKRALLRALKDKEFLASIE